jgi:hypothetical protein
VKLKRLKIFAFIISVLIGLLFIKISSADTAQVTILGVSSTPASKNTKLTAYVTLVNSSTFKVQGTLNVVANLSDGFQVSKSKKFKLKSGQTKTIKVTKIRLTPYIYDNLTSITATADITSFSQSSGSSSDLSGEWSGAYIHPYLGSMSVNAQITQSGSSITIVASSGQQLSGTFSSNKIRVRNSADNQTWTSLGSVTANYIYIRDYLFEYPQRSPPLEQSLILTR